MKNRVLCVLIVLSFLSGSVLAARPDIKGKRPRVSDLNQLVNLLPQTDGVVTLDARRFFVDSLPKLLSANQTLLKDVIAHLDDAKEKFGFDIRQFEFAAAGVNIVKSNTPRGFDVDSVILARGQISSAALVTTATIASGGKYREEKLGERTIYIFSTKELINNEPANVLGTSKAVAERVVGDLSREMALASYDANTIMVGSPTLVKTTLEGRSKVPTDLLGLLNRKPVSVANFALKVPPGMRGMLPTENDELGKNIDAIQYMWGSFDVTSVNAFVSITAQTARPDQAKSLLQTLEGLQAVGKAFLGGAKTPDKQVYAKMLTYLKLGARENEVTLDLVVPKADIDTLVSGIK